MIRQEAFSGMTTVMCRDMPSEEGILQHDTDYRIAL